MTMIQSEPTRVTVKTLSKDGDAATNHSVYVEVRAMNAY